MLRISARLALGITAALAAAIPVLAQNAPGPAPAGGGAAQSASGSGAASSAAQDAGVTAGQQVLLDQATYWTARGRPDLARQALDRLLKNDPNHADGLLQYGLLEARSGNVDAARGYLERLRQAHPEDTQRIARLSDALKVKTVSQGDMNEARRLAAAGQYDAAIQRYQQIFGGTRPPEPYALEYYQTLAGTTNGYEQAKAGLAGLAQGGNTQAKLAYAEVLSYRDDTRREAIDRLQALADDPVVGAQARKSWQQTLVWLKADRQDVPRFEAYLAKYPGDEQIEERLKTLRTAQTAGTGGTRGPAKKGPPPGPDPLTKARIEGFALLNKGDLEGAEARFRSVLAKRPGDLDAAGGLGVVRLRQNRFAEARDLLARAERGHGGAARWGEAYRSADFFAGMQTAQAALAAKRPQEAERLARTLVAKGGRNDYLARNLLGEALLQQDRYQDAEREFTTILRTRPKDEQANLGLFNALVGEGRREEALNLADRMQRETRRQLTGYDQVQAQVLRAKAKQLDAVGEDDAAYSAYEDALAADPGDPWLRLDFARFLESKGDHQQAQALVRTMIDAPTPSAASLNAGAIYYDEVGDYRQALNLIDLVPVGDMTADLRTLREKLVVETEVARAKAIAEAGGTNEATRILEDLNRRPPQSIEKTGIVAAALGDIGDYRHALQLVRQRVLRAGADLKPRTQIQYASVLLGAGNEAEAAAQIRQLERNPNLTRPERRDLDGLKVGLGIQQADRARQAGAYADAYDILYPYLADSPDDPKLLMALARLYASAGRQPEAQSIYQSILEDDPRNMDAVRGAVGAAIVAKDFARAKQLVDDALGFYPKEPRLYYLLGEVARAEGDLDTARKSLETARALRRDQLERLAASAESVDLPPNPFRSVSRRGRYPGYMPVRPPPQPDANEPVGGNPFAGGAQTTLPLRPVPAVRSPGRSDAGPATSEQQGSAAGTRVSARRADSLASLPPAEAARPAADAAPRTAARARLAPAPVQARPAQAQPVQVQPVQVQPVQVAAAEIPARERRPVDGTLEFASADPSFVSGDPAEGRGLEYAQDYSQGYDRYVPPFINPATRPRQAPDTLTQEIDKSLQEINRATAPSGQIDIRFRGRDGAAGLSRLNEVSTPAKFSFSPGEIGTLTFSANPVFLSAGQVGSSSTQLSEFGTNALGQSTTTTTVPTPVTTTTTQAGQVAPGSQNAAGVGLNIAYQIGDAKIDGGSTPIGFPTTTFVGGFSYSPTFAGVIGIKATIERRALTDSLLAYAGTKDDRTGTTWGGVTKNGGKLEINFDDGFLGAYVNGGYYYLTGKNVKSNKDLELGFGTYYRVYKTAEDELSIGLNLTYFGYDENLRNFTLGQGGYFSPQSYYSFSIPIEYVRRASRISYLVGGAVGIQSWSESRSAYFPNDPGLQGDLEALAASDSTIKAYYNGQDRTNFGFNMHGQVEYELSRSMTLGASASFDSAADWFEASALVYLRHLFGVK